MVNATRQSWCGRRFPNAADEASSQTTRYSILVELNYIVCICLMVSRMGFSFCIYTFAFSVAFSVGGLQELTVSQLFCPFADITVPANITSYTLRSLSGNTKYDTWIIASTIGGSARGFNHTFTTQKYGEYNVSHMMNCSSCFKNVP